MTTAAAEKKKQYTSADSITVLEGLDPVRRRPAMYIGSTDNKGLHHLVWEIVDNAVDEYLNGHGDSITVTLHQSGDAVTVTDNGRGIPVDTHPKHGKPGVELILTTLHAGGKFGDSDNYVYSGGLHGVGSSVVNALSRKLVATITRDGFVWEQEFAAGRTASGLQKLRKAKGHGTAIYFEPDPEIFRNTRFDAEQIRSQLEGMCYIHSGLRVNFVNEVAGEAHDLTQPGGLKDFLKKLIDEGQKSRVAEVPFHLIRDDEVRLEVALEWTEATDERIRSYVNGIRTPGGGTHENGLKSAITKAVRNYITTHDIKLKGVELTAEDIREGVTAVLSSFVREPQFQGQTKEKLNNPELTPQVEGAVRPALETWLNSNPTAADQIVGRIVLAAKARQASRDAANEVKRKSVSNRRLNLPGKLADCQKNNVDETELFIVEGDSAGGSAKQGRDIKSQAILPLRGKVLNAEGLATNKVLANKELADLVSAIGTGAGDKYNHNGLRYGKIILLMDADADGHHISTLLMDFFFRHMPELVRKGHLYLAQPPLYRIDHGKEKEYARDDQHREEITQALEAKNRKYEVTRFKGLGEMPARQLGDTTLSVRNRTLLKVEVDSNLDADQTFEHLLGKDPSLRYTFIMDEADRATLEELDV